MTIEEALRNAIEYEIKVRDVYAHAAGQVKDESGQKVVLQMAAEEQEHVNYLVARLKEWKESGVINSIEITRTTPTPDWLANEIKILKKQINKQNPHATDSESDISMLNRALEVEKETSSFYQRMVDEMPKKHKEMFKRFLEIEKGHLAIVEAEIDCLSGAGFWFGLPEFRLENE